MSVEEYYIKKSFRLAPASNFTENNFHKFILWFIRKLKAPNDETHHK